MNNDSTLHTTAKSSKHLEVVIGNLFQTNIEKHSSPNTHSPAQNLTVERSMTLRNRSKRRTSVFGKSDTEPGSKKRKVENLIQTPKHIFSSYIEDHQSHEEKVKNEHASIDRKHEKERNKLQKQLVTATRRAEKAHAKLEIESAAEFSEMSTRYRNQFS